MWLNQNTELSTFESAKMVAIWSVFRVLVEYWIRFCCFWWPRFFCLSPSATRCGKKDPVHHRMPQVTLRLSNTNWPVSRFSSVPVIHLSIISELSLHWNWIHFLLLLVRIPGPTLSRELIYPDSFGQVAACTPDILFELQPLCLQTRNGQAIWIVESADILDPSP